MSGTNYRPRRHQATRPRDAAKGGADKDATAAKPNAARRARPARPADPRRAAYDVLAAVRDRAAYANLLLPKLLAERQLAGRDAAFATELTYGTLRGQGTYDAVLTACSDRPLAKLDPPVLDILRLGAHQLLSTRVGAHAAVATSVDLAKSVIGPRVSGYVNAVLRRVATRDLAAWLPIVAPDPAADPDAYLAIRYSHPRWIVAAYRAALADRADAPFAVTPAADPEPDAPASPAPVTELEAALAAGNARPRVTLAAFPAGPPRDTVMPADAAPGHWSPYAFTLAAGDPTPLVEAGTAAVQDEGSQLAALALTRVPLDAAGVPERWLDMCAGPGGKARLLYGLACLPRETATATDGPAAAHAGSHPPRALLTAAELHPHRAALVREALTTASRTISGQPPAFEVIVADGTNPPWPDAAFDRILLDVPCSGLGALRRRPEARWRKSKSDLKDLTALQRALLRSALAAVRPGGVVAYVTCSPLPAETTDVVAEVTAGTPGVTILNTPDYLPSVPATAASNPQFAQLWPHRQGTDAIFIALLRRPA